MGKQIQQFILSLLFIFTFLSITLSAKSVVSLQEGFDAYTNFNVEYFEDTSVKPLIFEEIRKQKFQTIPNAFTFGYNTNNFWFRITIKNDTDTNKDMFLELTEIIHKELDLYIISSNSIKRINNGLTVPVNEREVNVVNPTFSLKFKPHETKELYIKLSSIYAVFGEFRLHTPKHFHDATHLKEMLYMFYFGAVITIGLYNLFIFFFLREKVYLYYVAYVFVFIVWSANYKGLLLPYTTMETYDILQITVPIFFTFLILFSQNVLETKKYFFKFHRTLNLYLIVMFISLIIMLIDMHYGFHFVNTVAAPLIPLLILVAFWALYKGHTIAKVYLLALTIYLLSLILLTLSALGHLPYSVPISNALIIGSFFEIILLSLLLAYRIDIFRQEKLDTQEKLLIQQKTESTRLSNMVEAKTTELSNINAQLAVELDEKKRLEKILTRKASTDSLTGILNRRAFFDTCSKEMNIAKRYDHDLSFIIIDIDYFKDINDSFGHLNGDIILIDLVNVIKNTIRTTDIFGRIGGEEFAVLMPETDVHNAEILAERIRKNISKNESHLDDRVVNVTVSIGLSIMRPEDHIIQNVLRRADLALFEAKENGRNQTVKYENKDA